MRKSLAVVFSFLVSCAAGPALAQQVQPAQQAPAAGGTLVVLPAFAEVRQANDEARLVLMTEAQEKDQAAAAARVNRKMKEGTEIVRRADPSASLKTRGYYSFPVYADDSAHPRAAGQRQLVGWRVGQMLEVTTSSLDTLPATVAAAQGVLALQSLNFGLSPGAARKLDEQRIEAAYHDLTQRIAAVARAMGRNPADAVLELVDFETSGNFARAQDAAAPMMMRANAKEAQPEPRFEPGETTLQTRVVGKVRFR